MHEPLGELEAENYTRLIVAEAADIFSQPAHPFQKLCLESVHPFQKLCLESVVAAAHEFFTPLFREYGKRDEAVTLAHIFIAGYMHGITFYADVDGAP